MALCKALEWKVQGQGLLRLYTSDLEQLNAQMLVCDALYAV